LSYGLFQERHPISEVDLAAIEDVLKVEIQLLDIVNSKVSFLSEAWKKEVDRIIGLRYNMDDRKSVAKESQESMNVIESTLAALDTEISHTTQEVSLAKASFYNSILRI